MVQRCARRSIGRAGGGHRGDQRRRDGGANRRPGARRRAGAPLLRYDPVLERDIVRIEQLILANCPHPRLAARTALAILAIGRDQEVADWLAAQPGSAELRAALAELTAPTERDTCQRASRANAAAPPRRSRAPSPSRPPAGPHAVDAARAHRSAGCGAGRCCSACCTWCISSSATSAPARLVGLLEEDFFGEVLNPAVTDFVRAHIATPWLADLFVGEYGLWTMGMTYALALILPIVTTFFLAFGVLEDSGYFSRLSVIANRMFAAIGLNGRAVLPMVLGLGCVTMATLTTRILHTPRERLITIYLMALAIRARRSSAWCSASWAASRLWRQ